MIIFKLAVETNLHNITCSHLQNKLIFYASLNQFLLHFQLGSGSLPFRPLSTPLCAQLALPLKVGAPAYRQCSASQVARTIASE